MDDLLVVGVDLATGHNVHVDDAPKHVWKSKGYGGDGTLVCRDCLRGDGVSAGTCVPLLYRGRLHGKRRPHFAHPPGHGPIGKHQPETPWHADAKKTISAWARRQPQVAEVSVERWLADGRRRSDVSVVLVDGTNIAIEIQQQPLTDDAWLDRHSDYAAAGVVDVWLWHPRIGVPGVALGEHQSHWQLNERLDRLGIPIAKPHRLRNVDHAADDLRIADHYPPCPGDQVIFHWGALTQFALAPAGLLLPADVQNALVAAQLKALDAGRPLASVRPVAIVQPPRPVQPTTPQVDVHLLHRIDGKPPWASMTDRLYRCQQDCGFIDAEGPTDGTHRIEDGWD